MRRGRSPASEPAVTLTESIFGKFWEREEEVKQFTWTTKSGFSVTVITYGAIIQSVMVPDKDGQLADVALGFDSLEDYIELNTPDLLGAAVGRCVGRIDKGTFIIDNKKYHVTKNCGEHHLHGAYDFDKAIWTPTVDGNKVVLSYLSPDGCKGFPGDLITNISYEVKADDSLHVEYTAISNKKTVVNLSNHSYFNLAGHDTGAVGLFEHTIVINSDKYLEGDSDWVPTGNFVKVGGSPFDLRTPRRLGDVVSNAPDEIRFHHNFVINKRSEGMNFVARVEHPKSGRFLEVESDQPSVIFYTGHYIGSPSHPVMTGKDNVVYSQSGGLCLETMNYVDAVNHENFPSPVLKPGDVYRHNVVYTFGANRN